MARQKPLDLTQSEQPEAEADGLKKVWLNERVLATHDETTGMTTISVSGIPFSMFDPADTLLVRHACVQLRLAGHAEQKEICAYFGHDRVTQHRWEQRFVAEGLDGLAPYRPAGRPVSITESVEKMIVRLHGQGLGMRRIASQLGLSLGVVRGVYERRGLEAQSAGETADLFPDLESETTENTKDNATSRSAADDTDAAPEHPTADDEAGDGPSSSEPWDGKLRPEYETRDDVPRAGALLALPVLVRHQVIETVRSVYQKVSKAPVYGLETTILVLVFMALWRIKRPEHIKEYSPLELGAALGLPRVPEVKTIRRKLDLLASRGLSNELMMQMAERQLEQREDLLGFLYVDGHVRVYSGAYNVAKGYVTQRHASMKATTDVWANDRNGDPLFVITTQINEHLTQVLEEVLTEAESIVGKGRAITVVFDRGGWSPQLFARIIDSGHHLITYRKGRRKDLPQDVFAEHEQTVEGHRVSYILCDQADVPVGATAVERSDGTKKVLRLRQVTKLCPSGHQTQVVTSRKDLGPAEVLWRMFARWRQENFFKYMREEFAIDALVEYGADGVDPSLERPNPKRLTLDREIRELCMTIRALQAQRCERIADPRAKAEDPDGWERFVPRDEREQKLRDQITELKWSLQELEARRDQEPERISAGDLERLKTDRKLLTDVIKTSAYRIETQLVQLVSGDYARSDDEGRKLIAAAMASSANLTVSDTALHVELAPQSSPHRSLAIEKLCARLNSERVLVPGTGLRLELSCRQDEDLDVASASS